ncbi:MAG: hypothetical protein P8013_15235, partial [Candidatus Sulfobium sp.]
STPLFPPLNRSYSILSSITSINFLAPEWWKSGIIPNIIPYLSSLQIFRDRWLTANAVLKG